MSLRDLYEFRDLSSIVHMSLNHLLQLLFSNMDKLLTLNILLSSLAYSALLVRPADQIFNVAIIFSMERLIGRSVDIEYVFIRQVYDHFIPDEIVTKEKRLRALFKQAGMVEN